MGQASQPPNASEGTHAEHDEFLAKCAEHDRLVNDVLARVLLTTLPELRCRRIVIIDDEGSERVFLGAAGDGWGLETKDIRGRTSAVLAGEDEDDAYLAFGAGGNLTTTFSANGVDIMDERAHDRIGGLLRRGDAVQLEGEQRAELARLFERVIRLENEVSRRPEPDSVPAPAERSLEERVRILEHLLLAGAAPVMGLLLPSKS